MDDQHGVAGPGTGGETADRADSDGRVHVRRLDVLDTLRWSWGVVRDRRELLGVALAANLPAVVAVTGVTQPSPSATPEFADWVLPAYLVQLLAAAVAGGVFSLTAANAVAAVSVTATDHARTLESRVVTALKRVPALLGTTVVIAILLALSALPAYAAMEVERYVVGLLLVLPAVYVFDRLLLAYQACVVDGCGPLGSVRAGWRATARNARKVFAVVAVYGLVVLVSNYVSGLVGGPYDVAAALTSAAIGAVLFPVFGLALGHLYLESSHNQ